MKKTTNYKGHRWTDDELKKLMHLWASDVELVEIAAQLNSTTHAIGKMVLKLRANGIPLKRRDNGHKAGRKNCSWTQAEAEYLIRRRNENATAEQIASDLGRTYLSINGMIQKLRSESVYVPMRGNGVRRLWDANLLQATFHNQVVPIQSVA